MQSIQEKQQEIIAEFSKFTTWSERYQHLISIGKDLEALDDQYKVPDNMVKGCQSQVWLIAELDGDHVKYSADSDALIVRGLIALLLRVYSGHAPEEILSNPPDFFQEIGMQDHLSMTRKNGLNQIIKQINFYAMAFQALLTRGRE